MLVMALWFAEMQDERPAQAQAQAQAQAPVAAASQTPKQPTPDTEVSGVVITRPQAAPEPDWSRKYNFDVRGEFKRSETPYLRRRPVDGCKIMAGGSVSPSGVHGVATGPVCSFRF